VHLFWVAGLLLALIDLPDFGGALGRIAGSLEKIAGIKPDQRTDNVPDVSVADITRREGVAEEPDSIRAPSRMPKERIHA
jgi:hypothetical protein